ncbi:MAG TPA: alpha/beta hydrolase, partial [Nevskiaceae bacterium]|nr:alpha/beta hydrolase [Nevskiaceae bacterium]
YGLELGAHLLHLPFLGRLPRGDGHPVMIVPGFGTTDLSSFFLRRALNALGYHAYGWGLGRNTGMNSKVRDALRARLPELHEKHGKKLSLIGWSLGGVFVREMARAQPDLVRCVITLGSPFNGDPAANNMMPLFRLANRGRPVKMDREGFERRRVAPPVPCIAIHSKTDGIVAWRCSVEDEAPHCENVEVKGTHFALATNLAVLKVIAERLAKPDRPKISDGR